MARLRFKKLSFLVSIIKRMLSVQYVNGVKIIPERGADVASLAKEFGVIGYPMVFVVLNKQAGVEIRWIRKTSRVSSQ